MSLSSVLELSLSRQREEEDCRGKSRRRNLNAFRRTSRFREPRQTLRGTRQETVRTLKRRFTPNQPTLNLPSHLPFPKLLRFLPFLGQQFLLQMLSSINRLLETSHQSVPGKKNKHQFSHLRLLLLLSTLLNSRYLHLPCPLKKLRQSADPLLLSPTRLLPFPPSQLSRRPNTFPHLFPFLLYPSLRQQPLLLQLHKRAFSINLVLPRGSVQPSLEKRAPVPAAFEEVLSTTRSR